MFSVIMIAETYDRRGAVAAREESEVLRTEDPIAAVRYRYARASNGYLLSLNSRGCVRLETRLDGERVTFADVFRIVEGEAAYQAVMNDEAPAQDEASWIASKAAADLDVEF